MSKGINLEEFKTQDEHGLEIYRKDAITAAEELTYPKETLWKLEAAISCNEIACIMTTARLNLPDEDRKNNK